MYLSNFMRFLSVFRFFMLEKELKVLSVDPVMIGTLLSKYGAKKTFDGYIYDIYFDTPGRLLQSHKYGVRLRFQDDACILAFKQKKKHKKIKCMIEKEFVVHDIFFVLCLLFWFGLVPYRYKEKKRLSFSYKKACFDIDMYAYLPPILEIEATKTKTIFSWIEKLHLENHVQLTAGTRWLIKYCHRVGLLHM